MFAKEKKYGVAFAVVLMLLWCIAGAGNNAFAAKGDSPQPSKEQRLAQGNKYSSDSLLVKFRTNVSDEQAEAVAKAGGAAETKKFKRPRKLAKSPIDRWRLVKIGKGADMSAVRAKLLKNPAVELVEYNYEVKAFLEPNDPLYPQLWGLNNTGQTGGVPGADIDAPLAWNYTTGIPGVLVAVIDTGVDYTHPDLVNNIWTNPGEIAGDGIDNDGNGYIDDIHGYDFVSWDADPFDDMGHGTHCAGTIAAEGDNGIGVVGVNWKATIMGVKFLNSGGSGSMDGAMYAVLYAADNGARVMSNSWGCVGGACFSQALMDAITTADQVGSLFVAAAGNAYNDNDVTPNYPSNYDVPNVVAVAATDHTDAKAAFSDWGLTTVDMGAPGVDILSTVPSYGHPCCSNPSGYMLLSGTSMATPHVSGAAALLFAQFPGITHLQVKDRLMTGVDPVSSMNGITVTGGRLNVLNAIDASTDTIPPDAVADLSTVGAGGYSITLTWTATGDDGIIGNASTYDVRYSIAPIDETNFSQAKMASGEPKPSAPGTLETFKVGGLNPGTTYYFALKVLDNAGNASGLSNVVSGATGKVLVIFNDDMESGSGNWTIDGSDGVGGPALWHLSTHRSNSPSTAFYYGREDTLTYETGNTNYGSITSVPIDLSSQKDSLLSFAYFLATENWGLPYDVARVQISSDDGATWTDLLVNAISTGGMVQQQIDISAYDGMTVRLRFSFNTGDYLYNYFEGFVVDDVMVTVTNPNEPPVSNPGGPYSGLKKQPVMFDGSGSSDPDGNALTYLWDFGDGTTGTGVNPGHSYAMQGTYTVTLVVNDGQVDSEPAITTAVIYNQIPTANPGGPYKGLKKQPVTFDGSSSSDPDGDDLTYLWTFDDGTTASGVNPTHTYYKTGTYSVTLTVSDGGAVSAPVSTTVTIINQAPVANAGGPYTGFRKRPLTLDGSGSIDPDGDALTYRWNFGDGTTGTGVNPTHTYLRMGTFTVTLVVNDGEVDSAPVITTVTVLATPEG